MGNNNQNTVKLISLGMTFEEGTFERCLKFIGVMANKILVYNIFRLLCYDDNRSKGALIAKV